MFDRLLNLLSKYSIQIFLFTLLLFGIGTCWLLFKWSDDAKTFGDNILVEFIIGGLLLIIPILTGIYIGSKHKELQFYDRIKSLLNTIKIHRQNGDITQEATRNIVIDFSNTLGDEILEEEWLKKVIRANWKSQEQDCGVCGLNVNTVNDKCKHCRLDCFAWKS